ncbi:MAG: hypothetical protein LBH60_06795 [Prevotellaceae bacterium]|nr:hypothetical protein [Prevotellaceae bacterium]
MSRFLNVIITYRRSTLRKPDSEFIAFANTVKEQCTQHSSEWNIDAERLNTLKWLYLIYFASLNLIFGYFNSQLGLIYR